MRILCTTGKTTVPRRLEALPDGVPDHQLEQRGPKTGHQWTPGSAPIRSVFSCSKRWIIEMTMHLGKLGARIASFWDKVFFQ